MARRNAPAAVVENENETVEDTNESAESKRTRLTLPAPTDAELDAYFGTGEEGEKNRAAALVSFFNRVRTSAVKSAAKEAGVTPQKFVTSEVFPASYAGMKFGSRRSKSGGKTGGRKVKRSAQDLTNALTALGGLPSNEDELRALLAKLNVDLVNEEATPAAE